MEKDGEEGREKQAPADDQRTKPVHPLQHGRRLGPAPKNEEKVDGQRRFPQDNSLSVALARPS